MSTNPSRQTKAELRVCGSCEWIFPRRPATPEDSGTGCPKCGFASYGAHWVYGHKCYRFKRTQQPWLDRKVAAHTQTLLSEIAETNAAADPDDLFRNPKAALRFVVPKGA